MSITAKSDFPLRLLGLLAAALIAGCGADPDSGSADQGATARDDRRGELLSYACQACHSLAPDGEHQIGPNLYGVFGRRAGTAEGFDYSDELMASGIIWSAETLDQWLADPAGFLPGTTMAFTGFQTEQDRSALIDWLIVETGP